MEEIKNKIIKLNRKADKLSKALWNEPKKNMYKKNMDKLVEINREIDILLRGGKYGK